MLLSPNREIQRSKLGSIKLLLVNPDREARVLNLNPMISSLKVLIVFIRGYYSSFNYLQLS